MVVVVVGVVVVGVVDVVVEMVVVVVVSVWNSAIAAVLLAMSSFIS